MCKTQDMISPENKTKQNKMVFCNIQITPALLYAFSSYKWIKIVPLPSLAHPTHSRFSTMVKDFSHYTSFFSMVIDNQKEVSLLPRSDSKLKGEGDTSTKLHDFRKPTICPSCPSPLQAKVVRSISGTPIYFILVGAGSLVKWQEHYLFVEIN